MQQEGHSFEALLEVLALIVFFMFMRGFATAVINNLFFTNINIFFTNIYFNIFSPVAVILFWYQNSDSYLDNIEDKLLKLEDFSITYNITSSNIVSIASSDSAWDFSEEYRLMVQILAGTKFCGSLSSFNLLMLLWLTI